MRIKARIPYRNAAGLRVPSVTTALSILNKPALVRWANKMGLEGIDIDKYKDELADIGTLTHYFIMCSLQEEIPDTSEFSQEQILIAEKCYRKYAEWEQKNPVNPILVESRLISEKHQYGGTPDLYGLCDKRLTLADFKTNTKGIFPEMVYQVSAYRQLLLEAGFSVSKVVILRLGRTDLEGFEEKTVTEAELEVGFNIFIRCLEIYKLGTKGVI